MDHIWNHSLDSVILSSGKHSNAKLPEDIDLATHSQEHKIVSSAGIIILILISLLGNTLVCLAVYQSKHLQSNVNYFVASLALSDLLVALISMPIWMAFELTKFESLPSFVTLESLVKGWTFVDILSGVASILNLVAISCERFWSIRSPLSHRMLTSNSYVIASMFIVWAYSLIVAAVYVSLWHWRWKVLLTSIIGFLLPLILIVSFYFNIYLIIQKKVPSNIMSREEHKKITRTVCILVVAFVVCWLPFFAVSLSTIHCSLCHQFVAQHQWIRSVVVWMHYLNSCCNPFLYCICNASYKDAFKTALKKMFHRVPINVRRQSVPISNNTRSSAADRCSSIQGLGVCDTTGVQRGVYGDEIALMDLGGCRDKTDTEPQSLAFSCEEFAARRDMALVLSRSESTEI